MIPLPLDDPTDSIRLADWLEVYALLSPDSNSSWGDLESVLCRASFFEIDDSEEIERKFLEVFMEIERRAESAKESYPFALYHPGVLQLKSRWEDFPAYAFCLCLSFFGLRETSIAPKLFEQISCLAVRGYLKGDVIGFGWPRKDLPSYFPDAVTEMCNRIGEGVGFREQSSLNCKDDTLDLVAWVDFADKRPSKVIMFGQCAAGRNWEAKAGDLDPDAFYKQWMQVALLSPPVKSFFTPHRIEWTKWDFIARKAGILFDRCRIAFWAHQEKADYAPYVEWTSSLLKRIQQ